MKNRNFILLFQGALTSSLAASFYSFAISFYILKITDNNAFIQGFYLFLCGLVYVAASFAGGVLADRWDRVKIVYGTDFLKGFLILLCLFPLSLMMKGNNIAGQLAVLFIIGIINNLLAAVFTPASSALIPEIVETDQLMKANSLFSIQNSFVSIFGVLLASLFYAILPIRILFAGIGILYLISGMTELFIHVPFVRKEEKITPGLIYRDFVQALQYLYSMKGLLIIIIGALFVNFFFTPVSSNLIPYLIRTDIAHSDYLFHEFMEPEGWSAVFSAMIGIGSVLMAVFMGAHKQKEKIGNTVKFWLGILAVIFSASAVSYVLLHKHNLNLFLLIFSIAMFLTGIASVGTNLPMNTAIQKMVERDMLAKINSVMTIGSQGLIPFASLSGGLVLSSFGTGALFLTCAAGVLVCAVMICLSPEVSKI